MGSVRLEDNDFINNYSELSLIISRNPLSVKNNEDNDGLKGAEVTNWTIVGLGIATLVFFTGSS